MCAATPEATNGMWRIETPYWQAKARRPPEPLGPKGSRFGVCPSVGRASAQVDVPTGQINVLIEAGLAQ